MPWSPLRGGWLSGKYHRNMDDPPAGSRVDKAEKEGWSEAWSTYNNDRTWSIIDALLDVAKEVDKSPAQVALNWLLQRPGVTAPIIGVRTMEHLEDNIGATGWLLSQDQMTRLNEVSEMELPYPYDFIDRAAEGR